MSDPYDVNYCAREHHWREGGQPVLAKRYRLKWPQPASTPAVMRYEKGRGPNLWMCDDCAKEAADWVELA